MLLNQGLEVNVWILLSVGTSCPSATKISTSKMLSSAAVLPSFCNRLIGILMRLYDSWVVLR
jgi:hypothetical protein